MVEWLEDLISVKDDTDLEIKTINKLDVLINTKQKLNWKIN